MNSNVVFKSILVATAALALSIPAIAGSCGSSKAHSHNENSGWNNHAEKADHGLNIVETAVESGSFNTLLAAVEAAGLADVLMGEGPFTVFAPTDEAFAKLPEGTIAELLLPENRDKLQAILTYHVVSGKVLSGDVVDLDSAKSVQGQEIDINVYMGKVMVDAAQVVMTDIEASNGVIHVIDTVMLPKL